MAKLNINLKLDLSREQLLAIGAACVLLLVCVLTTAVAVQTWLDATQTLTDRSDQLAGLQSRVRLTGGQSQPMQTMAAPPPAFLDAPTSGLAMAQFQAYLSQLIAEQRAVLVSSGIQAAERDDKSDAIRLQIALTATLPALQTLLYRIESGTPYVFVDGLLMQPGSTAERNPADPVLKVTLTVRAFWRRKIS